MVIVVLVFLAIVAIVEVAYQVTLVFQDIADQVQLQYLSLMIPQQQPMSIQLLFQQQAELQAQFIQAMLNYYTNQAQAN